MKHYFRPYRDSSIFIETGAAVGDGIIGALNAGFPTIHSIELSDHYYTLCKKIFAEEDSVHIHLGNSLRVLPRLLEQINEKCTFWLDAHWCGGATAGSLDRIVLMDELKIIASHHIKEHTILIDDIRLVRDKNMEWKNFSYCVCDLEEFIHTINPNYKITYAYGEVQDDILIARV